MDRFLDFFKSQLSQAKVDNLNSLQTLISSINLQPYSKDSILSSLQKIKTNYMQWSILIANEASTGLYFTQTHNKNSVLRKFQTQKQAEKNIEKAKIVVEQMSKTRTELAQIIELNRRWMKNMDESVTVFENRVDQILAAKHLKKEADSKDEVELSEKTDKTQGKIQEQATEDKERAINQLQEQKMQQIPNNLEQPITDNTQLVVNQFPSNPVEPTSPSVQDAYKIQPNISQSAQLHETTQQTIDDNK